MTLLVRIVWSDGVDDYGSTIETLAQLAPHIATEVSKVGTEAEYPEGVYPVNIEVQETP